MEIMIDFLSFKEAIKRYLEDLEDYVLDKLSKLTLNYRTMFRTMLKISDPNWAEELPT